jgi:UDP-N-acetyl-D-mannosaminuronic acid dehydrogenase
MSMICDRLGVDVWNVIRLANRHPRVQILNPGPGVGGHCIAVDPWFIVHTAPEETRLIRAAREVNDAKPLHVLETIRNAAQHLTAPTIACLGLTFKANVDDLRESPALRIVENLADMEFAKVLAADPHVSTLPASLLNKVELRTWEDAVDAADIVVVLVDHYAFREIPRSSLDAKILIDTRGVFSASVSHS